MAERVKLGDMVQDTVTGFRGIAVARYEFLHGCTRIAVIPKWKNGEKAPESATFDEPQLKVLKAGVAPIGARDTGGPAPHLPQPRPEPGRG